MRPRGQGRAGARLDAEPDAAVRVCAVRRCVPLGHWLQVKYKMPLPPNAKEDTPELNMPGAALKGFVDKDHDRFCTAEFVGALPVEDLVEVNGHHKEASAEVFFSLSMTADCMPGS